MKNYFGKTAVISFIFIISSTCFAFSQKTINVKDWGAKGDGVSDDYYALLKIADTVSKMRTAEVFFPTGVYKINQYHDGKNNLRDIIFKNCDGLKITGQKAVISVFGNFNRSVTRRDEQKHVYSTVSAIIPLIFIECNNLKIKNIELNGNVNEMTREEGVNEFGGHLLLLSDCKNVTISDLKLHHAQTDGIIITGERSENITINNTVSSNNARQGMSIIQLINGTFKNCSFINTGITGGKYGSHAPAGGIDIEPDNKNQFVKNIKFENCLFENNVGSQFICSFPATTDSVYFEGCKFNAADSSSKYTVIVNAKGINFDNCIFNCRNGSIYPVWQMEGSSSTFNNCIINSNTNGIVAVSGFTSNKVTIENCKINYTGNTILNSYFPYIRMKEFTFVDNEINIPEQYLKNKGVNGLIQNANNVGNNSFISNGKNVKSSFSFDGSKIK